MPISYKPGLTFATEPTCFNNQRFATREEALRSASWRFDCWIMPTGYLVEESNDPVNYRWDDAKGDVPLPEKQNLDREAILEWMRKRAPDFCELELLAFEAHEHFHRPYHIMVMLSMAVKVFEEAGR
jgi:hypothetical protein